MLIWNLKARDIYVKSMKEMWFAPTIKQALVWITTITFSSWLFFHINCASLRLFNWTGGFEVSSKTTVKCLSFDFMGHQVSSFTFPVNYVWDSMALIREGRKLFKDWWKPNGNEVTWRRGSNKKMFFKKKSTKCLTPQWDIAPPAHHYALPPFE